MNAAKIINLALDFETIQIGAGAAAGQVKHQEARVVEGFFSILDDSFRPVGQEFGGVVKRTAAELGEETAKKSLEISGISPDEILKGTDEEKFFADLRAMLDGARGEEGAMFRPVGHNINNFDIPILKRALGDDYHKYFVDESVDTLVETQRFVKSSKGASPFPSSKLADVFETLHEGASGPEYEPFRSYVGGGHHRARGDAYKSAYVANRLRATPSSPKGFANPHVTQVSASATPKPALSHLGLGLMATGALYMGSGSTRDPDAQPNPVLAKWKGIRQSYPTNPNEFEAMKPHAVYGFPGGRIQWFGQALDQVANSNFFPQVRHAPGSIFARLRANYAAKVSEGIGALESIKKDSWSGRLPHKLNEALYGAKDTSALTSGAALDKDARRVALSELRAHQKTVARIPKGSKLLGWGNEASVIRTEANEAIRIGQARPPRPAVPEILQPTYSRNFRGTSFDVSPVVERKGVTASHVVEMTERLKKRGIEFTDRHEGQLGFLGNDLVVVDPGSYQTRNFKGPFSNTGKKAPFANWQGIRQSYPTNPNEFEAMKPHPGYDFPGGRVQFYEALGRGRLTDANSIDPVKFANATGTKVWNVKHGDAVGVTDRFLSGSDGFTTEMGTGNWRPFLNKRFYDNYKKGKVSRGRMNRVIMHESSEVVYSKRFGSEAYSEAFGHAHPGVLANEARLASMMSGRDRAAYAREQRIYLRDFDKKVKEGYVPTRNDLRMQRMARKTADLMDSDYQYQHRPLGQMVTPERPVPVPRRPLGRTPVPEIAIPDFIPDPEPGSIPSVEPTIETLKYRRPVPKLVVRKTPRIPGPAVVEQYAPSVSPRSVPATPRGPATSTGLGASSFEAEVTVGRFPQPKPFTRVVIGRGTIAPVQPPPVVEVLKEAPRGPVIIARGPILRAAPTRAVPVPPMAESSAPAKAAVEAVERKISRPLKVIPGGESTKFGSPMLKMAAAVIAGAAAISYFVNSQPKETPEEEEASIDGIRQSYPTNPNQFEAIAPHSEFGFPGGREQPYNNRLVSPSKQSREDCIKSRVPGKKERLTFHPSKAFHKRRQPVRGNVGSRRER